MSAQARFKHGDPLTCPYTPSGAVTAGDVVVLNDTPFIAPSTLAANQAGSLNYGGAVYEVVADGAIAGGKKVYWDDATNKVSLTSSGNKGIGRLEPQSAAAADGDLVRMIHDPF